MTMEHLPHTANAETTSDPHSLMLVWIIMLLIENMLICTPVGRPMPTTLRSMGPSKRTRLKVTR